MIKDIIQQNDNTTPNSKQLAVLKENFPACFKADGSFDIERFKTEISATSNLVQEGYELKFLGKSYAKLLASTETTTVIQPNENHNSLPENANSENIYISGDNLDGLKHLLKSYNEQIKCIYIDPPYNTGSDGFVYFDNFNYNKEALQEKLSVSEEEAERILNLTKRGSASHSAWLMFMYSRLLLTRDLLKNDGVIFISIDDNEQANLKLLCDDVFGEENLIAQIVIQSNKRGQTYKQLAKTHEYLLVYVRSESSIINELKKEISGSTKTDDVGDYSERELRNRNPKYGRFNRPNLFYPIYINPSIIDANGYSPTSLEKGSDYSIEVLPLNSEGSESCWRWGTKKFLKNSEANTMLSNVVGRIKTTGEYGIYEKYRKGTYKAKTIWFDDIEIVDDEENDEDEIWDETGVITEQGSTELRKYEMGDVFDFPKPTYLLKKVLSLGSALDSVCLDFFSGSGSFAEAVLSLNSSYGSRKFISIQLPENLDNKLASTSASDKAKIQKVIEFLDANNYPHSLDYIGIERIKRAAAKIKKEHPDKALDLGFKHYILSEPNQNTLDKLESFYKAGLLADTSILDDFGKPTILATWLNADGYGLTHTAEAVDLAGYTAYYCQKHLYLIDPGFTLESMKALLSKYDAEGHFNPENLVLFGYSFPDWSINEMIEKNLRILNDGEKNLKINFTVRY
ncbi:site-specific DNA-methyltransferase [Limnovirga soli]|uniref:site-specific DNA-methyltransferase (adenine-specific) n=1 Tax=Limnovirga soli TaxID=2656915 RepID=A0A8J8FIG6_9BACT|nr:site-specific DNA-methyltransferase [Limnovirga soli]NNV57803.1 site-specific DNA-methyltransferase [Limnovirga soli]